MRNLKKISMLTLFTIFFASLVLFATNCLNVDVSDVSAKSIRPYETEPAMELIVNYNNNSLDLETTGGLLDYTYQYWIKSNVQTDSSSNLANNNYIWRIARTNYYTVK